MTREEALQAAYNMAALLGVIMQMSDDVKNAASPLDQQGKLLRLQGSLQKNGKRMADLARPIIETIQKENAA